MSSDERVLWKWISGILAGVLTVILAAWLIWVSSGTVENTKQIAVQQAVVEGVKASLCSIETTLKEIRSDIKDEKDRRGRGAK